MNDRRAHMPVLLAALLTALTGGALARNLFDRTHDGFGGANLVLVPTLIPHRAHVQLTWRY